jgi:hypothetical protein
VPASTEETGIQGERETAESLCFICSRFGWGECPERLS